MLVIIQNDPEVPCGAYGDQLLEREVPFCLVALHEGAPLPPREEVSAVIILGGAMGVHDIDRHPFLMPLKRWLRSTVQKEIPVLGICLGGQLLAEVLGARVDSPSVFCEKGTHSVELTPEGIIDPLFTGIPSSFTTFQWHNDAFRIPTGAVRLASSPACPNQAFRFGRAAWGTQFHPEVTGEIVHLWARWSEDTRLNADRFLQDFQEKEAEYRHASRQLLANFLRIACQ